MRDAVKISDLLNTMKRSRGWKFFEEELMLRLGSAGYRLKTADKTEEIFRMQGEMKAIKGILDFIPSMIEAGKEAKDNLEREGGENSKRRGL